MLQKLRIAAAALAAACLLSACTGIDSVSSLMRPPRLTDEQKAIDDALKASVDGSSVILKYPKSGDYRSAFIFRDLDGDNVEEAVAFYAVSEDDYPRVVVLGQKDGVWQPPARNLPGADQDVEFIAFANITRRDVQDIVIGWSNPNDTEITLGVYHYRNGALQDALGNGVDGACSEYLIDDLDQDGLSDLFLLSRGNSSNDRSALLRQISFDGYGVSVTSEAQLSDSLTRFAGVTSGKLYSNSVERGIFVDEVLTGDTLVTEVFTSVNGILSGVVHQEMTGPETLVAEESMGETLYTRTRRPDLTAVCADVNDDSVIEIPSSHLMPGYDDSDAYEGERIYLTEYSQLGKYGTLSRVFSAAINRTSGYRVEFPPEWIGEVTVVEQAESGEWQFFRYHGSLDDLSEELFRIRVVSQKDYQDKFLGNYFVLATRGALTTYYGLIPDGILGAPYAVTAEELSNKLFALL